MSNLPPPPSKRKGHSAAQGEVFLYFRPKRPTQTQLCPGACGKGSAVLSGLFSSLLPLRVSWTKGWKDDRMTPPPLH